MFADLHLHSTASDGTDAPDALASLCKAAGLQAFALTDHDTVAGIADAARAAAKLKLDFVPGIEISTDPDLRGTGQPRGTLHLLGLFIDPTNDTLLQLTQKLRRARDERNPRIIENLNKLGVRITYEDVQERADQGDGPIEQAVIGRPHIAQTLIDKGYVKSIHEAFARYIGQDKAAYARTDRLSAATAIDAIHDAGGLAALAHPVQLQLDEEPLEHAIAKLVSLGLDAIETQHSDHSAADVSRFQKLADRFDLLTTGGSDYHGSRKSIPLNDQRVAYKVYEQLRDAANK